MKSKKLLQITNYQEKLKNLLNNNIVDIILFGSFVKEGNPNDIDIAIVTREIDKVSETKNNIREIVKNSDIQLVDIESIYSPIWLTLIKEGFSVKENKFLHEIYSIKPLILFKYSLTSLSNVQKVQFERGIKKIIDKDSKFIARSVVLISITKKNEMIEFLKHWNVYYESQEYELLPLLRKESLI